jgi:excisionase family DNA binding protein
MGDQLGASDPWLTLAGIADELRVNPATVRLWVSKGQLKASRAGVRKWIVRRSDLEQMLAETNPAAADLGTSRPSMTRPGLHRSRDSSAASRRMLAVDGG